MARSIPDLALLLSVQAGPDPRVPSSRPAPDFRAPLDADFTGARIAWCGDFGGDIPFEPGVLKLCEAALPAFSALGATVEAARPDYPLDKMWRDFLVLRSWHTASAQIAAYRDPAKRAQLKSDLIWEIERGLKLSAEDVHRASVGRSDWYRAVARFMAHYDFLLVPSAQLFPFPAEEIWPKEIAGRAMDSYHRWRETAIVVTMTGCPSLNVPVGFDARGLPMGMQIVGPIGSDFRLMQLAHAYDKATGWTKQAPKLP